MGLLYLGNTGTNLLNSLSNFIKQAVESYFLMTPVFASLLIQLINCNQIHVVKTQKQLQSLIAWV